MMQTIRSRRFLLITAVTLVAAFISAKALPQGNPLVSIPWGVVAFLAAFIARNKKDALLLGGCIGFMASYAYLWFDDTSSYTLSRIIFLAVLIILPSLFGFLCGLLASWLGWVVRTRLLGMRHPHQSK